MASLLDLSIYKSGRWVPEARLREQQEDASKSQWRRDIPDKMIEEALKLQKLLQEHYDKKGLPIKERIDADYKLRFLIAHGNTLEGVVNDSKES